MIRVLALTAHWQGHLNAAIIAFVVALALLGIAFVFNKSSDEAGCFFYFLALVAIITVCVQLYGVFSNG